jgi:hypothetical protein
MGKGDRFGLVPTFSSCASWESQLRTPDRSDNIGFFLSLSLYAVSPNEAWFPLRTPQLHQFPTLAGLPHCGEKSTSTLSEHLLSPTTWVSIPDHSFLVLWTRQTLPLSVTVQMVKFIIGQMGRRDPVGFKMFI